MVSFRQSLPGKLVILAMGFYLLGIGLRTILEPGLGLRVFVGCVCVTICAIIYAIPMGMLKHVGQTIFVLCVVPFLVWAAFPGVRVLLDGGMTGLAYTLVAAGVVAIVAGLVPSRQSQG